MFGSFLSLYKNAFSGLGRDVWLLSLIGLINRAGTMVFPFLTLYFVNDNGFTRAQAGTMLLAFGAGSLIGSYLGGMASSKFGPLRVLCASLVSSGLAFLCFPLLDGYYPMMAGCAVMGLLGDAFRPAIMTAVAMKAKPHNQTRAFALLRMALHVGIAIGPAIAGVIATYNYDLLFLFEGLTCILAGILTPVILPFRAHHARNSDASEQKLVKGPSPLKDKPFMFFMLILLFYSVMLFQFIGPYPLYLNEHYSLLESKIGLILGFNALLLVAFEMVVVHLLEDGEPIVLFGIGSIILSLGWALMPFGETFAFALGCMTIFTLGEMITLPFSNALVAQRAGKDSGSYMGIYTAMFSAGTLLGPPLGLFAYSAINPTLFWTSFAGFGVLIFIGCRMAAPAIRKPRPEIGP